MIKYEKVSKARYINLIIINFVNLSFCYKKILIFKIKRIIIYFKRKFEMCFGKFFIYSKIIEYNFEFIFKFEIFDFIDDNNFNISLKYFFINNLN